MKHPQIQSTIKEAIAALKPRLNDKHKIRSIVNLFHSKVFDILVKEEYAKHLSNQKLLDNDWRIEREFKTYVHLNSAKKDKTLIIDMIKLIGESETNHEKLIEEELTFFCTLILNHIEQDFENNNKNDSFQKYLKSFLKS